MSTLAIRDLHVSVDTETGPKEILKGVDLTVSSGEIARDHGTQRFGQVDFGVLHCWSPEVPHHLRKRDPRRSGSALIDDR